MNNFQIALAESKLKIILEALTELESRKSSICEACSDDVEKADIDNELTELRLLLKPLRERAIKEYGYNIINFSRMLS
ncbi:MAG TPA: hypothetical protein VIM59_09480 [Cellvibrio sp.]